MKIENTDNRMRIKVSEIDNAIDTALALESPLLLEGLSGIGKTEQAKRYVQNWIARNTEWDFKFFQLQAFEYSDFTGIPGIKIDTEGEYIQFIQTQLTRICRPTIILLDDITQASLDVQRVLLGLTQSDKVVGFTQINFPVVVIGTANDNTLDDKAMVNEMQSALETRWNGGRLVVEACKTDLVKYFEKEYGTGNLFTRFLASSNCTIPEDMACDHELKIRPVPRILTGCVKAVSKFEDKGIDTLRNVVAQICGRKIAAEFYEFLLSIRQLDPKEFYKKNSKAIAEFAKEKNAETVQCIINSINGLRPLLQIANVKQIETVYGYIDVLAKAGQGECSRVLSNTVIEAFMQKTSDGGKGLTEFFKNNSSLIANVIESMQTK
jgi:hypothetical protein